MGRKDKDKKLEDLNTFELRELLLELRSTLTMNIGHQSQLLFELLQQEDHDAAESAETMGRLEREAAALGAKIRRVKDALVKAPKPVSVEQIRDRRLRIVADKACQQATRDVLAAYLRQLHRRGYKAKHLRKARATQYKRGLPAQSLKKLKYIDDLLYYYGWAANNQTCFLHHELETNYALGIGPRQGELLGEVGEA